MWFALLQITISNFPRPRITMDFALPRPLSTVISGPYKLSMAIDGQRIFVCLSLKPIFLKRSAATLAHSHSWFTPPMFFPWWNSPQFLLDSLPRSLTFFYILGPPWIDKALVPCQMPWIFLGLSPVWKLAFFHQPATQQRTPGEVQGFHLWNLCSKTSGFLTNKRKRLFREHGESIYRFNLFFLMRK